MMKTPNLSIVGKSKIMAIKPNCFDPKLFGDRWSVLQNETDTPSMARTELDITKIKLVPMLENEGTYITGAEKVRRLKESGHILLGADSFITFLRNQHLVPAFWKEGVDGRRHHILFPGNFLEDSEDIGRHVAGLSWSGTEFFGSVYLMDTPLDDGVSRSFAVLAN